MSDDVLISVENVSKKFARRLRHAMWYGLCDLGREVAGLEPRGERLRANEFWALQDVSFELKRGECLGVIGPNGAGKSTLLKLLNGIIRPTKGRVRVRGRVGALIEVGAGFHAMLTGRENIYVNGAILGMGKAEIDRKFDAIVEFADIGDFLDTPVKFYSSGMYVRLGFAIAAHLEPDILLIDEVLAVGDAAFQERCLHRMRELVSCGRGLVLISHNMVAIQNLCSRAVGLSQGRVACCDAPATVINSYLAGDRPGGSGEAFLEKWQYRYGDQSSRILEARLLDQDGKLTDHGCRNNPLTVEFVFECKCSARLNLSAKVFTQDDIPVLHLDHHDTPGCSPVVSPGRYKATFTIASVPLAAGAFKWCLAIHNEILQPMDVIMEVLPFQVEDDPQSLRPYRTEVRNGFCVQPASWNLSRLEQQEV